VLAAAAAVGLGVVAVVLLVHFVSGSPAPIRGAVIMRNSDPSKELPIAGVEVTPSAGGAPLPAVRSDASGFFSVPVPKWLRPGLSIDLKFRHGDYQPLELRDATAGKLYVVRLSPAVRGAGAGQGPTVRISDIVVKYSVNTTTEVNIGSAVRTFRAVNTGNVPCQGRRPCSPDGKWKAAVGSVTMDAGPNDRFYNVRASCIAGPCPFTRIETTELSDRGRKLEASAVTWSDTATFLVEAEVYKPVANDLVRQSYPVIFDRALTFILPAEAEGVSIEAELNGAPIVFPLGPALRLSWAACQTDVNKDQTKVYRCELKPGYRFSSEKY
jgi:hypothetical protein